MLALFGITREQAYTEISADAELHVEFGPVFDEWFRLEDIEEAVPAVWPLWAGIGPRTNFRGAVGIVGTYANVVMVRFKRSQVVRLLMVRVTCDRLYISLQDPRGFISAIGQAQEQLEEAGRAA